MWHAQLKQALNKHQQSFTHQGPKFQVNPTTSYALPDTSYYPPKPLFPPAGSRGNASPARAPVGDMLYGVGLGQQLGHSKCPIKAFSS